MQKPPVSHKRAKRPLREPDYAKPHNWSLLGARARFVEKRK